MINRRTVGQVLSVVMSLTCATNTAFAKDCSKDHIDKEFEVVASQINWFYENGADGFDLSLWLKPYIDESFKSLGRAERISYYDVIESHDQKYLESIEARYVALDRARACMYGERTDCVDFPSDFSKATDVSRISQASQALKGIHGRLADCPEYDLINIERAVGSSSAEGGLSAFYDRFSYRSAVLTLQEQFNVSVEHLEKSADEWFDDYSRRRDDVRAVVHSRLSKVYKKEKDQASLARNQQRNTQRQRDVQNLRKQLKAGTLKANTLDLAAIKYNALNSPMDTVIGSPRLKADHKYYLGALKVDQLESEGLVRVINSNHGVLAREVMKHTFGIDNTHNQRYAYLKMKSADIAALSANQVIRVVGKYVDNYEYVLTTGETKVAPVFKAMFVESAELLDVI